MNEKTLKVLEYDKIIKEVATYAVSPLGKDRILSLRPMKDKERIHRAQQETSETVRIILQKGRIPLEGLKDIRNYLKKAKIGSILSPGELLKIAGTLKTCEYVKDYMKEERNLDSPYAIVSGLVGQLVELPGLTKDITTAIISEEELSDHASSELYRIRKQIRNKNNAIRDRLNQMIHSPHFQKYLQEYIVTLRGDRYVIPVKQEYRSNVPGLIHDQSSTGATLFIEPMAVVEANNDLKALKNKEVQEIERILMEFTNTINHNYDTIFHNVELLTQLDVMFAKGKYSLHIKGSEPILNDKDYIYFKKARHPLISEDTVVASDIFLGKEFHTLLITGPNTGGKTVTLKTIGLLCLMGQSGLHIPVKDGSEMAIFQKIYADIGDEQSIEQSLSTFSSHMTNIVEILKEIDKNTLVLFDELGAGTDPIEGAALARAILEHLHKKEIRTVATTHYSELKEYALSTLGIENASVEFDIETLQPTYVLQIGLPGKSNAFEISKRLGLEEEIIRVARTYISQENIRFEDLLMDIEKKKREIEEESFITKKARLETEALRDKVKQREEELENKKDKIIQKAREEALEVIKVANKEAKEIIENLRKMEKQQQLREQNKSIQEARRKLKEVEDEIEKNLGKSNIPPKSHLKPRDIKPGDQVLITTLNQKGYILTSPDDKEEVQVQVGIMKINVPIANLLKIQENKENTTIQRSIRSGNSKAMNISSKLDLRGKTTEEAMMDIDKYLDDAYLAKLKMVTIVHGKGTGALRKSIHQLLKNHIHVQEFRIGRYNEGGEGATIVTIK